MFSTSRFAPAAFNSVELVVRIKRFKQTDATLRKLVVRIKCDKETGTPYKKLLVRIKRYKQTHATLRGSQLWFKNVTSPTGGSNWPPLVQKRHVKDRGIQLTSFGPKTSHHRQGDPTDLLWSKNVTSQTGGLTDLLWSKNVISRTGGFNWPPLIQKRHVTDRGIQLSSCDPKRSNHGQEVQQTSFDPKTSRHGQGDPTDLLDV